MASFKGKIQNELIPTLKASYFQVDENFAVLQRLLLHTVHQWHEARRRQIKI